jgi:hypothetical protein
MSPVLARRGFLLSGCGLVLAARNAGAREVAGVRFEERLVQPASRAELRLAGAGVFKFLLLRYYACGLYLAADAAGRAALERDAPRRVAMVMLRTVWSWEFLWGLDRGLADNESAAQRASLRESIDALRAAIRAIGTLSRGATVAIDYAPGQGTRLLVDGVERMAALGGKAFNDLLLRVWIGERPLDPGLKEALLGG